MISVIIFLIHIIFIIYIFYKRNKIDSFNAALLDLIFIILIFSVGWSLSSMLTKLIFESEGLANWLDRDTISLLILTIGEFFFYRIYFKDLLTTGVGKEK